MNKIKFSSDYPKLWGQTKARLISIERIYKGEFPLNVDLLVYDTKNTYGSFYNLPKNNYLQLIFLGNKKIPFCTIRRLTPQKLEYYKSLEGLDFEIIIGAKI